MENIDIKIEKFKELSSTQQKTKERAREGNEPWSVILAEEQTLGYGRKGQGWYSPKGGLYFSVILPKSQIEDLQTLTILAAFIVAKIVKEKFNLEPLIKLPNDVLLQGKKICGILTENVIDASTNSAPTLSGAEGVYPKPAERVGKDVKFSVMGIGLNTNIEKFPEDLKRITTSLKIETGKEVDNQEILVQIIKGLKEQLKTISE
jgi:BirA family biotin operon repressor/biotin-[acetyl-CoA-carboxylase] ligase